MQYYTRDLGGSFEGRFICRVEGGTRFWGPARVNNVRVGWIRALRMRALRSSPPGAAAGPPGLGLLAGGRRRKAPVVAWWWLLMMAAVAAAAVQQRSCCRCAARPHDKGCRQ